jgi:CheY-like chemotaxis protein/predicted transcriptional regulator
MISINDIQSSISDSKALDLLKTISLEPCKSDILFNKAKFTRKQYYSRITQLTKAGLIRRSKEKYFLTSFGKVVYRHWLGIERALDNYWRLKALDSLETLDHIPIEQRKELVENFIYDPEIGDILAHNEWLYSQSFPPATRIENNKTEKTSDAAIEKQEQPQQKELPLKIMIVDDEADVLLTYKSFLDSESYSVEAFTNPYDALHSFIEKNGHYYDLIIIDIRMPGINGLQLYRKLKAIDDSINVLFISALDAAESVSILDDNMDPSNLIRKPVSKEDFLKKVNNYFPNYPWQVSNNFGDQS